MSKRSSNCYECRNWRVGDFGTPECLKGHKPRFYAPTTMRAALLGDWGMKRRCKDFRGANDAPAE